MELLQLQYFCSVAELENITHAAKKHNIPQPAMSQTISRLEKELNTNLFDRKGNKLFLNEKGKIFYYHANEALKNIDNGIASIKDTDNQLFGKINLLIMENRNIIIDLVSEFSNLHPNVSFYICHDFENMHNFNCDLCISTKSPQERLSNKLPLIYEDFLLAVNKNHRLASFNSVTFKDFSNETFISMPVESSLYQVSYKQFKQRGYNFKTTIICDDPYSVRRYISLGLGIAFIPSKSWKGLLSENTVLIPIAEDGFHRTTHIFWDDSKYMTKTVSTFRDFIVNKIVN